MPPFQDNAALIEWVKCNVGRAARWDVDNSGTDKGEGRIVGYQISVTNQGRIIFDNHHHPLYGSVNDIILLPDVKDNTAKDKMHGGFAWILPQWIREFKTPAKAEPVNKKISDYPHECPRCHGPAYVGFNVRVECQAKCL